MTKTFRQGKRSHDCWVDPREALSGIDTFPERDLEKLANLSSGLELAVKKEKNATKKPRRSSKINQGSIFKPKRSLTAYNFFYSHERGRIVGEEDPFVFDRIISSTRRPHRKTHGKIGFLELSKVISTKWNQLGVQSRAFYEEEARKDLARYRREMQAYHKRMQESEHINRLSKTCERDVLYEKLKEQVSPSLGDGKIRVNCAPSDYQSNPSEKTYLSKYGDFAQKSGACCETKEIIFPDYEPCLSCCTLKDLERDLSITLGENLIYSLCNIEGQQNMPASSSYTHRNAAEAGPAGNHLSSRGDMLIMKTSQVSTRKPVYMDGPQTGTTRHLFS